MREKNEQRRTPNETQTKHGNRRHITRERNSKQYEHMPNTKKQERITTNEERKTNNSERIHIRTKTRQRRNTNESRSNTDKQRNNNARRRNNNEERITNKQAIERRSNYRRHNQ